VDDSDSDDEGFVDLENVNLDTIDGAKKVYLGAGKVEGKEVKKDGATQDESGKEYCIIRENSFGKHKFHVLEKGKINKAAVSSFCNVSSRIFTKEELQKVLNDSPPKVKKELEVGLEIGKHKDKVDALFSKIRNREQIDNNTWQGGKESAGFYFIEPKDKCDRSLEDSEFLKSFVEENKPEMYRVLLKIYGNVSKKKDNITKEDFDFANADKALNEKDFDTAKKLYLKIIKFNVWHD
jgi:hypothetical protein